MQYQIVWEALAISTANLNQLEIIKTFYDTYSSYPFLSRHFELSSIKIVTLC